jgi:hypothetical protein
VNKNKKIMKKMKSVILMLMKLNKKEIRELFRIKLFKKMKEQNLRINKNKKEEKVVGAVRGM